MNKLKQQFLEFILKAELQIFETELSEEQWKILLKWCVDHRLTYVFIKHLKASSVWPALLDNPHVQFLESRSRQAAIRQLKIQANLLLLDGILSRNNIEYQIIKGPVLAFQYYPDSAMRRMRDIDIIVRPEHFAQVCNLLLQQGYQLDADEQEIDFEARLAISHDAPPLTHPDFNLVIEVHHRVFSPRLQQSGAELSRHPDFWAHIGKVKIGNQWLPCESAEILLAHIILNGVRSHAFDNGPVLMFDLYFLIQNGDINWATFSRYCTFLQLENEVSLALSLLLHFYPQLKIAGEFKRCDDEQLIQACKNLMLSDPKQKRYERLTSSLKSGNMLGRVSHLKKILLPRREYIVACLGSSTRPYLVRLPAWWWYALKTLRSQYFGHNVQLQTSKELTLLFRWLNG